MGSPWRLSQTHVVIPHHKLIKIKDYISELRRAHERVDETRAAFLIRLHTDTQLSLRKTFLMRQLLSRCHTVALFRKGALSYVKSPGSKPYVRSRPAGHTQGLSHPLATAIGTEDEALSRTEADETHVPIIFHVLFLCSGYTLAT